MPKTPKKGSEPLKDMTFKVEESFHREYKGTAVVLGMSMKELLKRSFESFRRNGFK